MMERIILVDTSGSMAEVGKKSVVRYLIYAIENLLSSEWSGSAYKLYLWNSSIKEYDAEIDFSGQTNARELKEFLGNRQSSTILLVSDGSYSDEIKNVFKNAGIKVLALMVGWDCNKAVLQKIVGTENIFESTDVSTCVNRFMSIV